MVTQPVFIFGTGRCGSTHLQRLVTLATETWIWGEHDGVLEPLLRFVIRTQSSAVLDRLVFRKNPRTDEQITAEIQNGAQDISWINRFDKADVADGARDIISNLFGNRIPIGWSGWGFKEILYGLGNDVPKLLLDMFPTARGIFAFRDPEATLKSMIRAWSPELLSPPLESDDHFKTIYKERAGRWQNILMYFLNYRKNRQNENLIFVSSDKLDRPAKEILAVLGLPLRADARVQQHLTNPGPEYWPSWAEDLFSALYKEHRDQLQELFEAALAISNADFVYATDKMYSAV